MADPTPAELERALRDAVTEWRESQSDLDYEPDRLHLAAMTATPMLRGPRRRRAPSDRADLGPNMLITLGQMHVQQCVWDTMSFGGRTQGIAETG